MGARKSRAEAGRNLRHRQSVETELAELKQRLAKLEAKPVAGRSGKGAHPPAKKRK